MFVLEFWTQTNICVFCRQNICSVLEVKSYWFFTHQCPKFFQKYDQNQFNLLISSTIATLAVNQNHYKEYLMIQMNSKSYNCVSICSLNGWVLLEIKSYYRLTLITGRLSLIFLWIYLDSYYRSPLIKGQLSIQVLRYVGHE